MDNMEKIIYALENEEKIYQKLLSLSEEKKKFIIEGKINEIDRILQIENSLILEINKLENEREEAVIKLANEMGLPRENLTVTYVCEVVKDPRCDSLKEITHRIGDVLAKLKEVNDVNGKLIQQSLEYIKFSINLITDSLEPHDGIYEAKTHEDKDKKVSLFDAKV